MTIETKFELSQKVYIPQLSTTGRVTAFYLTKLGGLQYYVRYFRTGGNPENEYFFEDELSDQIPNATPPGFSTSSS